MYNRLNVPLIIAMVLVAMVLSAFVLVGLPKLPIAPNPDSLASGERYVRLADVAAGRLDLQPLDCPDPFVECQREKLNDGPFWDQLTPEGQAMLVRQVGWTVICWAWFIAQGVLNFFRMRRAAEAFYAKHRVADLTTIFEHQLYMPMPVAFVTWLYLAMAGAYVLTLV